MANVIFKQGTQAQYNAIAVKDANTLYWLSDVLELRKGEALYGKGTEATNLVSGLMSAEDKAKLDSLSETGALVPVDKSIIIDDGKIQVGLSAADGNALSIKDDGLFAECAEFSIERQGTAADGYSATYKLKRTMGGEVSYVGDAINIPKDLVLQSGKMEVAAEADKPYEGAEVGDPYIDLVLNDADASHIYIPVKGLVDNYAAGDGLKMEDNVLSINLHPANANGLFVDEDGIGLNVATATSAGAMSAVDKCTLDAVPAVYMAKKYEVTNGLFEDTVVKYNDGEIRIMFPDGTAWKKQQVGGTGDKSKYYVGFRAYAPAGATGFKEDLGKTIEDNTMYRFENNDFAGTDEFGRKYSIVWLPAASYDEANDAWTYYGANSHDGKFIGWYYSVEWYDANNKRIGADTIRINLSNESCHTSVLPYYMKDFATNEGLDEVRSALEWKDIA